MRKRRDRPVVLCWAGWFPHRERPYEGIFVRRHLELIGGEVILHTFTIRHGRRLTIRFYDADESFGKVRHYEIPSRFFLKLLGYFLIPLWESLRALKHQGRPDVFYLQVSYPYAVFTFPLIVLGIRRWILTEHWSGYVPADGRFARLPGWYRGLLCLSLRRFDKILPVSGFLKKNMMSACSIPEPRFCVVPNVVRFPETPRPLPALTSDTPFKLLCIAALNDSIKNISLLLQTINSVRKKIPRLQLAIVGEGPDKERLMALAERLELQAQVHFVGSVSNERLEAMYHEAHLFVLLSRYETFSVAVAEALSHGRPVVVSACGGPEEYVSAACGRLVPQGDVKAAAQAICEVYENYVSFSAESIQNCIRSRFDSSRVKNSILQAFGFNVTS